MTCTQNPTAGGSAGVSAAAKDSGGAVEYSPDGVTPVPVVDTSSVGDKACGLDPQVVSLCHDPGSVDFAAVAALNDTQKATLMESLTSARDEARARGRGWRMPSWWRRANPKGKMMLWWSGAVWTTSLRSATWVVMWTRWR